MSRVQTLKGRIIKTDLKLENMIKELKEYGHDYEYNLKHWSEITYDYGDLKEKEYTFYNGVVYEINYKEIEIDNIFEIDKDGNFLLSFYNGSCCLNEAIGLAFKKRGEKND